MEDPMHARSQSGTTPSAQTAIIGGGVLGVTVALWQLLSAATGTHALFPLVATGIELVVLVGTLATTRATRGYGAQLMTGLLATVASLPIIALGFVVTVFVVFPDVLPDMAADTRRSMEASGASPAEIEATLAMITPVAQGAAGLIGTFVTGLLVSLLAPLGLRKRT